MNLELSLTQGGSPADLEALLELCLRGQQDAYASLYGEYVAQLYRLCYGLLQDRRDAEEVVQDALEYAFRRLAHFDPSRASFRTWLYQIAISRCRNKRRRKSLVETPLAWLADALGSEAAGPEERAEAREEERLVWQALASLSPKLRETAVLRYYASLNYAEIGLVQGIPAKTAESRMRLAHAALREKLLEPLEGR